MCILLLFPSFSFLPPVGKVNSALRSMHSGYGLRITLLTSLSAGRGQSSFGLGPRTHENCGPFCPQGPWLQVHLWQLASKRCALRLQLLLFCHAIRGLLPPQLQVCHLPQALLFLFNPPQILFLRTWDTVGLFPSVIIFAIQRQQQFVVTICCGDGCINS